jgi:hypothetical protein
MFIADICCEFCERKEEKKEEKIGNKKNRTELKTFYFSLYT